MCKYKLMRLDNVMASAYQGVTYGKPDIFDEVYASDDLVDVLKSGWNEDGNLHIRVGDSRTQWFRARTDDAYNLCIEARRLRPGLSDTELLAIIPKIRNEHTYFMTAKQAIQHYFTER